MAKVCKSCGAEMTGEVCKKCGWGGDSESRQLSKLKKQARKMKHHEALGDSKPAQTDIERGRSMSRVQLLAVIIVLAVAGIIFIMYRQGVFSSKGYEEVIGDYFQAVADFDFDAYTSAMPDALAGDYKAELEQFGSDKKAYMKELYADYIEAYSESFEINVTLLNKDSWTSGDISNLKDMFEQYYNESPSIKQVYDVTTEVAIKGSNGFEETANVVVSVGEIDGEWSVIGIE